MYLLDNFTIYAVIEIIKFVESILMSKKDHLLLNKIAAGFVGAGLMAMIFGSIAAFVVPTDDNIEIAHAYPITVDTANAGASVQKASADTQIADITPLLATADLAHGQKLSKKCTACHSFNDGGPHKVGPNLWNIVDQAKGAKDGYSYSKALLAFGGNWDIDALNKFLLKPKKYISGTKMNFGGFKKDKDRAAMISYLQSLK